MIDCLKLLILEPDIKRLLNHPLLDFKREVSESTGELSTKTIARYHHCKITVHDSGVVLFTGSIHKMYNSLIGNYSPNYNAAEYRKKGKEYKGFNGNQFYYHEVDYVRKHIFQLFCVPNENIIVQNIEFGLNLTTSFNPRNFIDSLLMLEMKSFEYQHDGHFAQSEHSQYTLKIYNKGNQYDMALNTLRFEMKVTTMEHQRKDVGIRTMADINMSSMNKANKYLLKQINKLLYCDPTIIKSELTPAQQINLKEYSNPRFWTNLNDKQRYRSKKKLNEFIEQNSQNLKLELISLINQNWVEFERYSKVHQWVEFETSNIVSDLTHSKPKKCPITGQDISMQKPTSTMLSNTGLKHIEKYQPDLFKELKRKLLTGRENKFEHDIYSMMSKQIRNRKNNRRPTDNNQLKLSI